MNRPNSIKNIFYALLSLISISLLLYFIFSGEIKLYSFTNTLKIISFGSCIGISFWLGNWAIGVLVTKKLPWKKNPKKSNLISLLSFITYGILISPLVPFIFQKFVFHATGKNLYFGIISNAFVGLSVDFIFVSIYYSKSISEYYRKALEENEILKHENLLAKYEALKNQVNPHFLFNSLNTLTGIIEQQPEQGTLFVKKLSQIYRYILDIQNKDLVTIQEEMKFIQDYLYLSKMRFGEALRYEILIPEKQKGFVIPLGLQLPVENALKHNSVSDDTPLNLSINLSEPYIVITNNLQKKNIMPSKSKPIGLENLKNRYQYITDLPVEITKSDKSFKVRIPIINEI